MKVVFGEREVKAYTRFGLKPMLAKFLLIRPINFALLAAAQAALPLAWRTRLPLNRQSVAYRLASGSSVRLLEPGRDLVARDIFWGRGAPTSPADALVLRILERLCADVATFVDIGTYAGLFALVAARANPALRTVAYDIVPENFLLTVRNVVANDLVARIECRLSGLGEEPSVVRIPTALGLSSNATSVSIGSEFAAGAAVPITTLDREAGAWQGPMMIKIDVEGFEVAVLKGAAATLRKHRPDILCEVLPGDPADVLVLEALLRPLGYRFLHPTADGLLERPRIEPRMDARDWLFTTRTDIRSLSDRN